MNVGQKVQVPVHGGRIVERVICQITETKVVATTDEEYARSTAEDRQAIGVGYDFAKVYAS
jgi:hypothetical protein